MTKTNLVKSLVLTCFALLISFSLYAKSSVDNFIQVTEMNKVCMVNDFYNPMADFSKFMVQVEKKKYYGCCAMCKDKLQKSIKHRVAKDPYTYEKITKSDAFIVADKADNGKTFYFKNKENFVKWVKFKF
ncbi:MAG: hypothetical protein CME70_11390 [Halobacteriovorax sp.]|nr:hypothetical protein [Halobacteriovorax sp.]